MISLHLVWHLTQQLLTLPLASTKLISRLSITASWKKNQIVEWKVCLPPIEIDHAIMCYQSKIEMIGMNEDRYSFRRNMKFFSGEKFNRDLAFADCRPMYQQENCVEMFTKFNEIFQSLLDQHAPTPICDSPKKTKKSEKPWISKELRKLIEEKHHLYNQ